MTDLLARFRYPLGYLLLASLCVISITSRQGPIDLGLGARLVLRVTVPLERLVTLPFDGVRGLWREYVALVGVRRENGELRQEMARLQEENLQYREAIVASERFQRLAGFRASRALPMVPANVVAQDVSPWFRSLIIDQGSAAGIRAGMPVVTDLGVVGVVAGTTPREAKVLVVTDLQSRVEAFIQRSRARGTVRGRLRPLCDFEYLARDEDVQEGDLLLTSGLGEVFPKGLIVGRVARIERKPYGLFQRAEIEPAVDFQRLEEVFVILERRELPSEEEFEASAADVFGHEAASGDGAAASPETSE